MSRLNLTLGWKSRKEHGSQGLVGDGFKKESSVGFNVFRANTNVVIDFFFLCFTLL